MSFREFKPLLASSEAEEYAEQHPQLLEQAKAAILLQLRLSRANLEVISKTLVRAQYAHSKAFTHAARVMARQKTGHYPTNMDQIFARHPGMHTASEETRRHCLDQLEDLSELFGRQGFFTEEDFDDFGIPETEEQATKRARGNKVKSECVPWRWRFSWDNHEGTVAKRAEKASADAAVKAQAAERAQEKLALEAKWAKYKERAATPKKKIPHDMKTKYEYATDFPCDECGGFWSTWVALDLKTTTKFWKTPDRLLAQQDAREAEWNWFCGLGPCQAICAQQNREARAANKLTREAAAAAKHATKKKQPKPKARPKARPKAKSSQKAKPSTKAGKKQPTKKKRKQPATKTSIKAAHKQARR